MKLITYLIAGSVLLVLSLNVTAEQCVICGDVCKCQRTEVSNSPTYGAPVSSYGIPYQRSVQPETLGVSSDAGNNGVYASRVPYVQVQVPYHTAIPKNQIINDGSTVPKVSMMLYKMLSRSQVYPADKGTPKVVNCYQYASASPNYVNPIKLVQIEPEQSNPVTLSPVNTITAINVPSNTEQATLTPLSQNSDRSPYHNNANPSASEVSHQIPASQYAPGYAVNPNGLSGPAPYPLQYLPIPHPAVLPQLPLMQPMLMQPYPSYYPPAVPYALAPQHSPSAPTSGYNNVNQPNSNVPAVASDNAVIASTTTIAPPSPVAKYVIAVPRNDIPSQPVQTSYNVIPPCPLEADYGTAEIPQASYPAPLLPVNSEDFRQSQPAIPPTSSPYFQRSNEQPGIFQNQPIYIRRPSQQPTFDPNSYPVKSYNANRDPYEGPSNYYEPSRQQETAHPPCPYNHRPYYAPHREPATNPPHNWSSFPQSTPSQLSPTTQSPFDTSSYLPPYPETTSIIAPVTTTTTTTTKNHVEAATNTDPDNQHAGSCDCECHKKCCEKSGIGGGSGTTGAPGKPTKPLRPKLRGKALRKDRTE